MQRGRLVKWKGERVSKKISESRDLNKYLVWITDSRGILMVVTSLLSIFQLVHRLQKFRFPRLGHDFFLDLDLLLP